MALAFLSTLLRGTRGLAVAGVRTRKAGPGTVRVRWKTPVPATTRIRHADGRGLYADDELVREHIVDLEGQPGLQLELVLESSTGSDEAAHPVDVRF